MFKFFKALRYKSSDFGRARIEDLNSNLREFKHLLYRCYEVDYECCYPYNAKQFIRRSCCNEEDFRRLEYIENNIFECLRGLNSSFYGLKLLAFYEHCCTEGEALCLFCGKAQEDIASYIRLPQIYPLYKFNERRQIAELENVSLRIPSDYGGYPIEVAIGVSYYYFPRSEDYSAYGIEFSNPCCFDKNYTKLVSFIYDRCYSIAESDESFTDFLYHIVLSFLHICSFKSRYGDSDIFYDYTTIHPASEFSYDYKLAPLLYAFMYVYRSFRDDYFNKFYKYFRKPAEYCMDKYIEEVRNSSSYIDFGNYNIRSGISPLLKFEDMFELLIENFNEWNKNEYKAKKCKKDYTIDTHIYMYELLQDLESFFIENPPEFLRNNKY